MSADFPLSTIAGSAAFPSSDARMPFSDFDLSGFVDPRLIAELLPGVVDPSARAVVHAVFDDADFSAVVTCFSGCATMARLELVAFFCAAGARTVAQAERSVERYGDVRALVSVLAPGPYPCVSDDLPEFLVPAHSGVTDVERPAVCERCGACATPKGRELCAACEEFAALVLRGRQLRTAAGFGPRPLLRCLVCDAPLRGARVLTCSTACQASEQRLLARAALHARRLSRAPTRPPHGRSLLPGVSPPGRSRLGDLRASAIASLPHRSAIALARERTSASGSASSLDAAGRASPAVSAEPSSPEPSSPEPFAPAPLPPGARAVSAEVAALRRARDLVRHTREYAELGCVALVGDVRAAVAASAAALERAGCAVAPERYRGAARAGFDLPGFTGRVSGSGVLFRVAPLGGVRTVHGVFAPRAERFALCRAEVLDPPFFRRSTCSVEIVPGSPEARLLVHRAVSGRPDACTASPHASDATFADELDALAVSFAERLRALSASLLRACPREGSVSPDP